jgi:putrescine transport system permease protein
MLARSSWFNRTGWRSTIIATPYVWLMLFFLLPFLIVVAMSLAHRENASPPIAFKDAWPFVYWDNYARLVSDSVYIRSYLISTWNAALATVLCLLIGYPMALGMTRVGKNWQRTC